MNNIDSRRTLNTKGAYSFCYFLLFFSFLLSMNLWIGWDGRSTYFNYIISFFLIVLYATGQINLVFSKRNIISFLLFLAAQIIIQKSTNVFLIAFLIIQDIPLLFILCLDDNRKVECLEYITKYFAYIVIPGIFIYFLLLIIDIPSLGTICVDSESVGLKEDSYLYRMNYVFYEPPAFSSFSGSGFRRFNGPFHEPGHLGMMSAFLLFANQFDFKKKRHLWVIVLSIILSLSLAGYVLAFMGFIMIRFYQGKIRLARLLLFAFLFGVVYLGAMFYNGGDNTLNNAIFARLQYDESTGSISGDNRASDLMMDYYLYMMQGDMHTLLNGYDADTVEIMMEKGGRGVGFVYWMVLYGVIGVIAAAAFYLYFMLTSQERRYANLSFVMICLMFVQRSYPFWTSWVILYVYGIALAERISLFGKRQRIESVGLIK